MAINNYEIHSTIYFLKNTKNDRFKTYRKMRDMVEFIEKNKFRFDTYINDQFGISTAYGLFGDFEDGDGYYASLTSFIDYFRDDILEIKNSVATESKKILKEYESMKSQVNEMGKFITKYHLEWLFISVSSITKRTSNKELNQIKEEFLPYKDEIINGYKNILGEGDLIDDVFDILELDNETIKENA